MEVIYTGLRQTPEQIVATAAQEDVDAIGLSHPLRRPPALCRRVLELLRERGMEDVLLFVGGIIPSPGRRGAREARGGRGLPARGLDPGRHPVDRERRDRPRLRRVVPG